MKSPHVTSHPQFAERLSWKQHVRLLSLCNSKAHISRWTHFIRARRGTHLWGWTRLFCKHKATFKSKSIWLVDSLSYDDQAFKLCFVMDTQPNTFTLNSQYKSNNGGTPYSTQAGLLPRCIGFYFILNKLWNKDAVVLQPGDVGC